MYIFFFWYIIFLFLFLHMQQLSNILSGLSFVYTTYNTFFLKVH